MAADGSAGADLDDVVDQEAGREELESAAPAGVSLGHCRGGSLLVGGETGRSDPHGYYRGAGYGFGGTPGAGVGKGLGHLGPMPARPGKFLSRGWGTS